MWFAANNIGVCWYGRGNPVEPSYHGLEFVIMLAIAKTGEKNFRRDYKKSKRKTVEEIWTGEPYGALSEVIRYAPSACNSQPWLIEYYESYLAKHCIYGAFMNGKFISLCDFGIS